MVSQLIISHDENGIAVLKSRGASKGQIILSYLVESSLIGVVAFIFGPLLGVFICSVLGSSNGFLEFVQRTALHVTLNVKTLGYSLGAVAFLILTMLVPVIAASRTTIVKHKQDKARARKSPVWKKFFLDIVLLLVSGYGLYRYQQQQKILESTGAKANELQIDPLLFLTSTVFVLGAGLLFIMIYPYLIRFIYWIGRKIWSPAMYISLIQVGRSKGQEQFLMLFIILAISTGLFNANSARTINKNIEDKISYSIGADVRMMAVWRDTKPPENSFLSTESRAQLAAEEASPMAVRYIEPDYYKYSTLSGAGKATKVLSGPVDYRELIV
jgi:putative ABC transport system permease protein